LDDGCSDDDVLKALEALKNDMPERRPENVRTAHKLSLITNSDLKNYSYMDKTGKKVFNGFCDKLINTEKENIRKEVEKGLSDRKFMYTERVIFQELGNNLSV